MAAPRPGPIPLPLLLVSQAATLMGSLAALPSLKSGSLPWKPSLAKAAAELRRNLDAAGPESYSRFALAVTTEAAARQRAFLDGISAYRRHPYRRPPCDAVEIWRQGSTRVLGYGGSGPPVLVIPSLVNRASILDLTPEQSVMGRLAARGHAAFLLDWDAPGEVESGFTLTDYVLHRLEPALDAVAGRSGMRPALMGYCMGGLLALALAQRRPETVRALVLLATPWDFHAGRAAEARLLAALARPLGAVIDAMGGLPVELLQALFVALDPGLAARKFAAFAGLDPISPRAQAFVALEDWVNDGVPLTAAVARECLFDWYGANAPARGQWRIDGRAIRPETLIPPALAVVPTGDRIVPQDSALPLAAAIPTCQVVAVRGGHVGMLFAPTAEQEVHRPISDFLSSH